MRTKGDSTDTSGFGVLFHRSPLAMLITALDGAVVDVNDAALRLLRFEREQMIGHTSVELGVMTPDERQRMREALRIDGFVADMELRLSVNHGGACDVILSIQLAELDDEPRLVTTLIDITERKRIALQLQQQELQLRDAQQIAHLGSWDWDLRTNLVTRSEEMCRIFGFAEVQRNADTGSGLERVHPEDRQRVQAALDGAAKEGRPFDLEYRLLRDAGPRIIQARAHVVVDSNRVPVRIIGTAHDITERRQVEAKLHQADRLASVGQLAAGVAHEINNPLAYVMNNLEMIGEALRELDPAVVPALEDVQQLLFDARQGAHRIREIVTSLRRLSRPDTDVRQPLDVRKVLDLAIAMTYNEVRHRARLVKEYEDVPLVAADEGHLAQVFSNLLLNAVHALPEGQAASNEIRVTAQTAPAGGVIIEIRDTGTGIPAHLIERIFDPFFTTKDVGEGTGLGLSICHGIVTALGGSIRAESAVGSGTTMILWLPQTLAVAPPVAPHPPSKGRRARILVIDDDAMVGESLRRALRDHAVTVATNAAGALVLLLAGTEFDVILCDLMMPDMTGMDLYRQLSDRMPEVLQKIVFVTGGAFTTSAMSFLEEVPNLRVEKPFDAATLRILVQKFV